MSLLLDAYFLNHLIIIKTEDISVIKEMMFYELNFLYYQHDPYSLKNFGALFSSGCEVQTSSLPSA